MCILLFCLFALNMCDHCGYNRAPKLYFKLQKSHLHLHGVSQVQEGGGGEFEQPVSNIAEDTSVGSDVSYNCCRELRANVFLLPLRHKEGRFQKPVVIQSFLTAFLRASIK